MIPFNKPYFTGKEIDYISEAMLIGKISGDGIFTKKCHAFFESNYSFKKVLLTTSCTDALEMAAILINTQPGDEIIMPAFTFVSTANAFVLRGGKIVFADSNSNNPNIDASQIENLITKKTKAIVAVHYAGVACDMDKLQEVASKHKLFLIEDAALALDSFYMGNPLGSFGHLAAFSFHESKNISSGEGGMLVINDDRLIERAEIIREKGTNRSKFLRGEIDKYSWVDIGSSFLPSEIIAAFLYAQLESLNNIQLKRKILWNRYYDALKELETSGFISLPQIPGYASNNAHLFYILCNDETARNELIKFLKSKGIHAVFHYLSLHNSPFYIQENDGRELIHANHYSQVLLRLPMYYELKEDEVDIVTEAIKTYYLHR